LVKNQQVLSDWTDCHEEPKLYKVILSLKNLGKKIEGSGSITHRTSNLPLNFDTLIRGLIKT